MRRPASGRRLLVTAVVLGAVVFLADTIPAFSAARRQMWSLHTLAYQEFRAKLPASAARDIGRYVRGAGDGLPAAPPTADPSPGRYHTPQRVTLRAPGDAQRHIHYTRDGSMPTRLSPRYRDPIVVDATTPLRWRVLNPHALPGEVGTGVYLIEPDTRRLPLLALTMDSLHLWGKYSGIYSRPTERGREFERHAYVSLIESDGHEVGFEADVRIHGGFSRLSDKKSFRIRFRLSAVAPQVTATDILRPTPGPDEHTFVLRSSSTTPVSRLADALSTSLFGRLGKPVSRAQPVRVTLNGRYWGIYDVYEYIDAQFLAARFGPGPFELLAHDSERRSRWLSPVEGSGRTWAALTQYLQDNDLADQARFDSAATLLDPRGMIDYWAHNIYAGNLDWPYNNAAIWRDPGTGSPFRFLLWDGDATFSSLGDFTNHNTLAWSLRDVPTDSLKWNADRGGAPDDPRDLAATAPMRAFLRNAGFRDAFIARMLVLLSTSYAAANVYPVLDSLVADVADELPYELSRWGGSDSAYQAGLARMRRHIAERPGIVRRHLAQRFDLGDERALVLDVRGPGGVELGGRLWRDTTVTLTVLAGTRLPLHAAPDVGSTLATPLAPAIAIEGATPQTTLRVRFRAGRPSP
jgi:hypothetical protein